MMRIEKRIGQYHYNGDYPPIERTVKGTTFLVGISTAYNAMGLIGSEHNGIFVLDETNKSVVIDRHVEGSSGGFGPYPKQIEARDALLALDDRQFIGFLAAHPRFRYIPLPLVTA